MSNALESYIVQAALARGIDPQVALRVARGEGGLNDPFRHGEGPAPRSQATGLGPTENSFGPFQLYVSGTGAGLGDRAVAAGIDPRKNWQGGVDFALDEAKRAGWGQWYGAKAAGITGMMGIGGVPSAVPTSPQGTSAQPTLFGDVVAPPPVTPAAFMQSRQQRDQDAAANRARREALFGGLGDLYG